MDDAVWEATVFCKNRQRLLAAEVLAKLLVGVVLHPKVHGLLSREHYLGGWHADRGGLGLDEVVPRQGRQ